MLGTLGTRRGPALVDYFFLSRSLLSNAQCSVLELGKMMLERASGL